MVKDYELKINDIYKLKTIRKIAKKIKLKPSNLIAHFKEVDSSINEYYDTLSRITHSRYVPENISVDKVFNNFKSVLITGATGYVGNFILRFLLEHSESNIFLIIRGKNSDHIKNKIKDKLWYYHRIDIDKFDKRISYLQGDIAESKFGLTNIDYIDLNETMDIVINCAAKVDHFGQYDEFYKANVESVRNLIDFCLLKEQVLLHHISTVSVVKAMKPNSEGISILEERNISPSSINEIDNFYIKTKILAELLIEDAKKIGLKSNVYRLGNVTFCKKTGIFQQNPHKNAFMRLVGSFVKLGLFPNDHRINFDLSYIDVVIKALGLFLCKSNTINHHYNIINPNKISLSDLATKIAKLEPKVKINDINDFYKHLISVYDSRHEPLITHLYSSEYWSKPSIVNHTYTQQILEKLGHEWKEFDAQDASNIISIVSSMS
ncbi:SDR family oxidoreductase [Rickettsia argasii]|uniref:NAD dependent epimerase/dehydratase family protein n=1 Tax=Rickettsia argasii T170-B TaxID=1268837 RepID=A0A0F3RDT5_9RICK|nr:SDR family oxidoreductase [Rickettsia argasii]KJW04272.1 NAD dependent epimerase/dehydratase family protein [Rickettsia argasii T170-B]